MQGLRSYVSSCFGWMILVGVTNAAITDNLQLYLPFDANAGDQSGNGVATTIVNSVNFAGPGIVGNAAGIANAVGADTATANYLHTTNEFAIGTSDFSVSLWVNGDSGLSVNQNDAAFVSNKDWNSGGNLGWVLARGGGGGIQWNFTTPASGRLDFDPDVSISEVGDNQWHHVAVSHDRDGSALFFYDGAQIGNVDISAHATGSIDAGLPTAIGTDGVFGTPWDAFLNGSLDEVAIWDRVVSAPEMEAIYNSGVAGVAIPSIPDPIRLTLEINQATGEIKLQNTTTTSLPIRGYSILSDGETLNPASWTSIAAGGDANNGGSVDGDDNWIEFTAASAHGDLSEGSLGEGALGPGQSFSLGTGAWSQYFEQDLVFEYIDGNGNVITSGFVVYTGNGGDAFAFADLDFDGDIDGLDWNKYVAGLGTEFVTSSLAEAYAMGDLNGDLANNHADFAAFRAAYDDANGAGAFAAMVPEPSSYSLSCCFLAMGFIVFRKRAARLMGQ